MVTPAIDLQPLRRALGMLREALQFWNEQAEHTSLKPHLRSAVIQAFEFTYELSVRLLKRTLVERSISADAIGDLSFNDLLRLAADAQLMADPLRWRQWRALRNATSHAYDEHKAQAVAEGAGEFVGDAAALMAALEKAVHDGT